MIEYYKNLSLENLFYIDENGIVQEEEWKDIPNWEGMYQCSDLGRVKSFGRKVFGGKTYNFKTTSDLAEKGNAEAQAALSSYNVANNYGNFIRRVPSEDEANAVLMQAGLNHSEANALLEKKNPNVNRPTSKPNTQEDFNAKWAKLKKGQTLVGPDGQTYKKK